MSVYKNIYLNLFNAVTDAIRALDSNDYDKARQMDAQRKCEDTYITISEQGETRFTAPCQASAFVILLDLRKVSLRRLPPQPPGRTL